MLSVRGSSTPAVALSAYGSWRQRPAAISAASEEVRREAPSHARPASAARTASAVAAASPITPSATGR